MLPLILFCSLASGIWCGETVFPSDFKFGVSSSAFQIEGGWNASDKALGAWDYALQAHPHMIPGNRSGDVACDSYHQYKRDVQMLKELGVNTYRFSLSWSRLLPTGFANFISKDGRDYYSNLIDELLVNDIEPIVTLYHFDFPQKLQAFGGWNNESSSDWFAEYASVAFALYANRVKTWLTINEPMILCHDILTPSIHAVFNTDQYLCTKNVMLAHAKAWRNYDTFYRHIYNGKVSIVNQIVWYESDEEPELAELSLQYDVGLYSDPIFSEEGGWPSVIEKAIEDQSLQQGYSQSRLPSLNEEEKALIKGTYDFYGVNYYTSCTVRRANPDDTEDSSSLNMPAGTLLNVKYGARPEWTQMSGFATFNVYPEGLRKTFNWVAQRYGPLEFMVMENGYVSKYEIQDTDRADYIRKHLEQVALAINEDGLNVTAYNVWALMDNFEWASGYATKFGLYQVDFQDPERPRTPRYSAQVYKEIIKNKSL